MELRKRKMHKMVMKTKRIVMKVNQVRYEKRTRRILLEAGMCLNSGSLGSHTSEFEFLYAYVFVFGND